MKKIILLSSLLGCALFSQAQKTIDYSFVVVGCNRVDNADTLGQNPSTANVYHLNRTFYEVSNLNPVPAYFFFAGDLVIGYNNDTAQLARQLRGWIALYKNSPLASKSTKMVAIPGNHETQDKAAGKKSYLGAEQTWLRVMKDYIPGGNGPVATGLLPGTDSLITDQSMLTYSINYKKDHFVLIDTDPTGRDWRVPYKWIKQDIKAAKANGARHVFAIGHKPAYASMFAPQDGLVSNNGPVPNIYKAQRDSFWVSLENNQAEAMFAAHNHIWDKQQPHPNKTYQIIAGNGGSRLEKSVTDVANVDKSFFGYTLVTMYTDGTVNLKSMGRQVNLNPKTADYTKPIPNTPTIVKDSFDLTFGSTIITAINEEGSISVLAETMTIVPNPTDKAAIIHVNMQTGDFVNLSLYNSEGKLERVIKEENLATGLNQVTINTESLKPGVYVMKLTSKSVKSTQKLIVNRQ